MFRIRISFKIHWFCKGVFPFPFPQKGKGETLVRLLLLICFKMSSQLTPKESVILSLQTNEILVLAHLFTPPPKTPVLKAKNLRTINEFERK